MPKSMPKLKLIGFANTGSTPSQRLSSLTASHHRSRWYPRVRASWPYSDAVEEAICFGWSDSTVNTLDGQRGLQLMTPRRARSDWIRLDQRRADEQEVAQANGWWALMDRSRICPSRTTWPRRSANRLMHEPHGAASRRRPCKQMLWWAITAAKPDTRARRIARIVTGAAHGRRTQGGVLTEMKPPLSTGPTSRWIRPVQPDI
jgi:hypothetical protein